jgi:hypothetical protein
MFTYYVRGGWDHCSQGLSEILCVEPV